MAEADHHIAAIRRALPPSPCPGLFRIVPARDGGLCRIRVELGALSSAAALRVAVLSERHGNGTVELTNRANLQLRGIAPAEEARLIAGLLDAGLGPHGAAADDRRNVLVSPTAGIDASEITNIRPLARALTERLSADPAVSQLSPKFAVLLDGGGAVAVTDHPHDIWLAAVEVDGIGTMFRVGLASALALGAGASEPVPLLHPEDCAAAVAALLHAFCAAARGGEAIARMRHLRERMSEEELWHLLGMEGGGSWRWLPGSRLRPRAALAELGHLGIQREKEAGLSYIGAVPPLGRMTAAALRRLAGLAAAFGRGTIRLTPWRSVILPGVRSEDAPAAAAALEAAGLVLRPGHPLARMAACAGSAGCASAASHTKEDAAWLADGLASAGESGPSIHLSGCAKSCAVAGTADVTLVAVAERSYDVYRRNGAAGSRFGRRVAAAVPLAEAQTLVAELAGQRAFPETQRGT